mgnify:FL=1
MLYGKYLILMVLLSAITMLYACNKTGETIVLGIEDLEQKNDGVFEFYYVIKNNNPWMPFFIYVGADAFDIIAYKANGKRPDPVLSPDPDKADQTCFMPLKPGESIRLKAAFGDGAHGTYKLSVLYEVPKNFKKWGQNVWVGKIMSNTVDVKMKPSLFSREVSYIIKTSIIALLFIITSIITYRLIRRKVSVTVRQ